MPPRHRVLPLSRPLLKALLLSVCVLALCGSVMVYRPRKSGRGPVPANVKMPPLLAPSIPQMLLDINSRIDPSTFRYKNAGHATILRARLDDPTNPLPLADHLSLELLYTHELLKSGKSEEALKGYRQMAKMMRSNAPTTWEELGSQLLIFEAIGYLRIAEQQNCCDMNNSDSCLLPISGSGVHTRQEGSRGAIQCLLEALKMAPNDTSARWLLNIAYMTIGEYPQKVPARWLIPLKTYGGEYPLPKFTNLAPQLGLDTLDLAGSVCMEDFQGNGLLDLVVSTFRTDGPLRYFRNNGDGTFTDRTKEAGVPGEIGGLNMITTDYNNDGRPDIVILRGGWLDKNGHYPLSLLRNDGKGHFTNVTREAGLLTIGPTQTAVAFDYNSDGWLDLFVGYESTKGDPVPCRLFCNNGNGTFTDVTTLCDLDIVRFVKGVVNADYNHDGRPDLYLSCSGETNKLLRNDGPAEPPQKGKPTRWKFTDVTASAGVGLQSSSFSCSFFDYDNDGWPDLYVGGYGGAGSVGDIANDYLGKSSPIPKAKLYRNNRDGTFADISKQAHLDRVILGMGLNFGDLDNDGWLDFYAGTGNPDLGTILPNRMFRNHDGKWFDEVTTTGDFGHLQKGHGIAFGDLRNNGQQDVFLVAGGAYEGDTAHDCLYINPGNKNHWLKLQLTGVQSNRVAIGAEICVTVATPKGDRQIYKTVSSGASFGNNSFRQSIGLGNATAIKQVAIRWPASGLHQILTGLSMDRFYKVREGDTRIELWTVPTFRLPVTR